MTSSRSRLPTSKEYAKLNCCQFLQVLTSLYLQIVSDLAKRFPDVPKWTREAVTNEVKIGGLNHLTITGSPTTVADRLQQLVDEGDIDGFSKQPVFVAFRGSAVLTSRSRFIRLCLRNLAWHLR